MPRLLLLITYLIVILHLLNITQCLKRIPTRLSSVERNKLNDILTQTMKVKMVGRRLAKVQANVNGGGDGNVTFHSMKIFKFDPAAKYSIQTNDDKSLNAIKWTGLHSDWTVRGEFSAHKVYKSRDRGFFELRLKGVDFALGLLTFINNGRLHLTPTSCKLSAERYSFQSRDLPKSRQMIILKLISPKMERVLCKELKGLLENYVNKMLTENRKFKRMFGRCELLTSLWFKNRLREKLASEKALSIQASVKNVKEQADIISTPLNFVLKNEIRLKKNSQFFMGKIQASDYVLYQLLTDHYKNGRLYWRVTKRNSPRLSEFLKMNCDTGISFANESCLGGALPELAQMYPGHSVELELRVTQSPKIVGIIGNRANITLEGRFVLWMELGNYLRQALEIHTANGLRGEANFERNILKGNLAINSTSASVVASVVPFSDIEEKLDGLADLAAMILESMLKNLLEKGVDLPEDKLTLLVNRAIRRRNLAWPSDALDLIKVIRESLQNKKRRFF